ncbi:MAG: hypothetical protein HZC55_01495 [Verrucomicrobia bacterium]|nr:hypothetical protein [Verrucomicrobiota bacterium]
MNPAPLGHPHPPLAESASERLLSRFSWGALRRHLGQRLLRRRRGRLSWLALGALALIPLVYVLLRTADARRDIVYGEEFDTALAFVVRLKEGMPPAEFLRELVAVKDEHRTATGRLVYAASYWLTGTINFAIIDWIAIGSILATCGLLLFEAGSALRRVRLAVLLSLLLFQLEHYENYLWPGTSLENFQVLLFASAALQAVARGRVLLGAVFGVLASFTLAHGLMVWPVGAALLWRSSHRRRLPAWVATAAVTCGAFFHGFAFSSGQAFPDPSWEGALRFCDYWLSLLGAVPALGHEALEPFFGAAFLGAFGFAVARGAVRRDPFLTALAAYAAAAAAMLAFGRAELSGGEVISRYFVLSALAWALVLFLLVERHSHPRRPLQFLVSLLPGLIAFNVVANREFLDETEAWIEARDRAATRFKQHGEDGRGPFTLHPDPQHATQLLQRAEALGVYRLGPICRRLPFPARAEVSTRLAYFVDELTVNARSVFIRGWAALPGLPSERGQIHLVLRSATGAVHLFTTVGTTRPDVAKATGQPGWEQSGFRFARRRDRLPVGEYQIGLLTTGGGRPEYLLTAHRVRLVGDGEALLATGK